jgi:hypothetical protein
MKPIVAVVGVIGLVIVAAWAIGSLKKAANGQ